MKWLTVLLIFLLSGCTKADDRAPQVSILAPKDGQSVSAGTSVPVQVSITDSTGLYLVHLWVTNLKTSVQVIHEENYAEGTTYSYNEAFVAEAGTGYRIEVQASNHKGNSTDKQITIQGN